MVESSMFFFLQTVAFAFILVMDFPCYSLTSTTGFSYLERFELDGLECKSPIFSFDKGFSKIVCALKCSKTPACAAVSYNPSTYECFGCYMFKTKEMDSQEDSLYYGLIGATDVVNVGHGKQAVQSSIYNGHYAARGVDGNTDQNFHSYACFETSNKTGTSNWWYVDLQNSYILTEVKLFNRLDCCAGRANNIKVLLVNSLDNLTEVAFSPGQIDNTWSVLMPTVKTARYVKLVHNGHSHFHLCEVQVFARAALLPTD